MNLSQSGWPGKTSVTVFDGSDTRAFDCKEQSAYNLSGKRIGIP
jgi:hypothetical protein